MLDGGLTTRMTPRCAKAIEFAREACRAAAHTQFNSLHLLAGLLRLDSGIPFNLLKNLGITSDHAETFLRSRPETPDQTAAAAFGRAEEEAYLAEHSYLGTEHLFLAILAEAKGPAADIFRSARVDQRDVTFTVLAELGFETPAVWNKLLLLEDNAERIAQFRAAMVEAFPNWQVQVWDNAPEMLVNCEACLDETRLISLDHDLNPLGTSGEPGCGRDASKFLAGHLPFAPVIIHSTNADAAWSMHNDLRFARWRVSRVGPIGEEWVNRLWLPKASELVAAPAVSRIRKLRAHGPRFEAALDSLEGLVVGEALGEMLAYNHAQAESTLERGLPPAPWLRTDDGEMALAIVETLKLYGYIHQDALSRRFAWRFELNPMRGYGQMTYSQLTDILRGADWRKAATAAFGGQGSMGNGGAMRVAPLGAYFFNNMERVVSEAARSSTVTHTHSEGVAGAIAIAVAAAQAVRLRSANADNEAAQIFEAALNHTPQSKVREGILTARDLPPSQHIFRVALTLGNGSLVTAPDTVPYTIWCAAHNLRDFRRALMTTITGGGDCDTNSAIVGGIVGARVGREGIPDEWRSSKEKLPY